MKSGLVLVTGAAGFLGSALVKALLKAGYQVRATDKPGVPRGSLEGLDMEWMDADLLEKGAAARVVHGVRGVVHAAGLFDLSMPWEELYDANAQTVEEMGAAALAEGVDKFVHISSATVYGKPQGIDLDENTPIAPRNHFEKSRALGEEKVWALQRLQGLPATVLRPALLYGPGAKKGLADLMALYVMSRQNPYPWLRRLNGGATSHHVHVEDVARAAVLLLGRVESIGNAYNIGDRTPISWGELSQYLCNLCRADCASMILPRRASGVLSVFGRWMPSSAFLEVNRKLVRDWEALAEEHGLAPELRPRVDREIFDYLGASCSYDTSAIQKLGFAWSYPRTLPGVRETLEWYEDHRWIPGVTHRV